MFESIVTSIGLVAAVMTALSVIVRQIWKALSGLFQTFNRINDLFESVEDLKGKVEGIDRRVGVIEVRTLELTPNSGAHMKDKIDANAKAISVIGDKLYNELSLLREAVLKGDSG